MGIEKFTENLAFFDRDLLGDERAANIAMCLTCVGYRHHSGPLFPGHFRHFCNSQLLGMVPNSKTTILKNIHRAFLAPQTKVQTSL